MARPEQLAGWADLGVGWLTQYAPETTLYSDPVRERARAGLDQLDAYLSTVRLAIIRLSADPSDSAKPELPVERFVDEQFTRLEAEFSGRFLTRRADADRRDDDPSGITWAVAALHGLSQPPASERLEAWIDRGVRVLAVDPGADVRRMLDLLESRSGPIVAFDLVDSAFESARTALAWFEERPERSIRVPLLCSRAASVAAEGDLRSSALELEARLGALGGTLAVSVADLSPNRSLEELLGLATRSTDRPWIGLSSGFPAATLAEGGPANARGVLDWLQQAVPPAHRARLAHEAAEAFVARLLGR